MWAYPHKPLPPSLKADTCVREEQAAAARQEPPQQEAIKLMFFLAYGCHAALDAPKKARIE